MNPVLGIDYCPWKCYKCKKKYKGVYHLNHYWKGTYYREKKRTCYNCHFGPSPLKSIRPIVPMWLSQNPIYTPTAGVYLYSSRFNASDLFNVLPYSSLLGTHLGLYPY